MARLDRIAELSRLHLLAQRREGPALHLVYDVDAAPELRRIVDLERDCCAFLSFELAARNKVVELTITAPADSAFKFMRTKPRLTRNAPRKSAVKSA